MAKQIMNEPTEIPAVVTANRSGSTANRGVDGQVMVPRRCSVEELSFAAHVDYAQNSGFIEEVGAKVVILVHGEQNNMGRLKSALLSKNSDRKDKDKVKIYNPKNCEELRIPFKADKIAKVPPLHLSRFLHHNHTRSLTRSSGRGQACAKASGVPDTCTEGAVAHRSTSTKRLQTLPYDA